MPSNRKIVFANGEYYHLFDRGVERRPVFTNRREFLRAIDLINFYRFDKLSLRYSKYLALDENQRQNMLKFTELETIVLTHDINDHGLKGGDIGAVVNVYDRGNAAEVEFVTATGRTIALVTLKASDIRTMKSDDVFHVRGFASA